MGGPATAGCGAWVADLVTFGEENDAAVDFISCHAYGGGGSEPGSGDVSGVVGGLHAVQQMAKGRPVRCVPLFDKEM